MPATAFGVSRYIEGPQRQRLIEFLRFAWQNQFGVEPNEIEEDLKRLRRWFRPELSKKSARDQLIDIAKLPREVPSELGEEAVISLPSRRGLVTPEGRMLLALLEEEGDGISDLALLRASVVLTKFYGDAYRSRLENVLSGEDARPNTLAFVVFLLINGSIGEKERFDVPQDPDLETRLAEAVFRVQDVFVTGIGGKPLIDSQRNRLRSNWVLTEAAPQFPFLVIHADDAYWLREDAQDEIPEEIGRVLAARRSAPTDRALKELLEQTLEAYTDNRPVLSALNLSHYRPSRLKAEFRRILSAYRDHLHL